MLELNIKTKDKLKMLQRVEPIVKRLLDSGLITHFHFFLDEPWADIVMRFETANPKELKTAFGRMGKWQDFEQFKESKDWGPFWPHFKGLFQAASLFALALATYKERMPICNVGKLIHCLLNEWGYARRDEMEAYFNMAMNGTYLLALEDSGFFFKKDIRTQPWDAELKARPKWIARGLLKV